MIWPKGEPGYPSPAQMLPIIRARAERAGADLGELSTGRTESEVDVWKRWFSM